MRALLCELFYKTRHSGSSRFRSAVVVFRRIPLAGTACRYKPQHHAYERVHILMQARVPGHAKKARA